MAGALPNGWSYDIERGDRREGGSRAIVVAAPVMDDMLDVYDSLCWNLPRTSY